MTEDVYPTVEPIPYDPEDPEFTQPVTPLPEPEREYLSAQEAIDRREEQKQAVAVALADEPPAEPRMVTEYKKTHGS